MLKAKKVLLYAPILKWYFEHGLEITAAHRMIDYISRKIFNWFVQEVANMRRREDIEAEKALLAEIFKLLGNSAYGKFIKAVERQTKVLYTKDGQVANVAVLLRFLGSLYRQARLRAYPDGHRQYVLRPFVRHSGRSGKTRTYEGV